MTFYTSHQVTPRTILGNDIPVAVKAAPTMTWAEMARSEGHRKGTPRSVQANDTAIINRRARLLQLVRDQGPIELRTLDRVLPQVTSVISADLAHFTELGLIKYERIGRAGIGGSKFMYEASPQAFGVDLQGELL